MSLRSTAALACIFFRVFFRLACRGSLAFMETRVLCNEADCASLSFFLSLLSTPLFGGIETL